MPYSPKRTHCNEKASVTVQTKDSSLSQYHSGVLSDSPPSHGSNRFAQEASPQVTYKTLEQGSGNAREMDSTGHANRSTVKSNMILSIAPVSAQMLGPNQDQRPHDDLARIPLGPWSTGQFTAVLGFDGPLFNNHYRTLIAFPFTSRQVVQTQSRLPPDTVARKAPRKATVVINPTLHDLPKIPNSNFKDAEADSQPSTPYHTPASAITARKTPKEERAQTGLPMSNVSLTAGCIQSVTTDNEQRTDGSLAVLSHESPLQKEDKLSSLSATITPEAFNQTQMKVHKVVIPLHGKIRSFEQIRCQFREFNLTSELNGVRRALGQESWTEYLAMIERSILGEITDREFEVQESRIFQVPTIAMRRKIQGMVLQRMALRS